MTVAEFLGLTPEESEIIEIMVRRSLPERVIGHAGEGCVPRAATGEGTLRAVRRKTRCLRGVTD